MPAPKKRGWAVKAPEDRGDVPPLHKKPVVDTERLAQLKSFQPAHSKGRFVSEAVDTAAERVLSMPFRSKREDGKRMQRLTKLTVWILEQAGEADLDRALSDPEIDRYCESLTHMTQGSRNSYRSYLRRDATELGLRDKSRFKGRRSAAASAYTEHDRNNLWLDGNYMTGPYAQAYRLAYDLAFAAGARAQEMATLTWDMITKRPEGAVVTLVNINGVVREVPIGPVPAGRLLGEKGKEDDGYLFRPDKADRRAVVNKILSHPTGKSRQSSLKLATARNTYIVHLLRKPIPYVTIAYLADLNPGSSLTQDLLPFAGPSLSPADHAAAVWGEL